MSKEFEAHETRSHWTLIKNIEVNNEKNINMVSSIIIYLFGFSSSVDSLTEYLKKKKLDSIKMEESKINWWETYAPVVNWISVRSLLYIASVYELSSRSIDFVFAFLLGDLDVDVFMDITLGMGVD